MKQEYLWNNVTLYTPSGQFSLGTDSVACAGFAKIPKGSRVADLGCGCGAIGLMLLASDPTLTVTGIELQLPAVQAAQENGRRNSVALHAIAGDLRQIKSLLPANSMDAVISNPPYFPVGSGQPASGVKELARSEATCTLAQLCDAAQWLLRWGGCFTLVHRPERLADLIWELRTHNLEPKRIQFVRHKPQSSVSLILLEAKLGGKPGLHYEPDLVLFHEDGTETTTCKRLYHKE